ncbi:MAG: MATE family efflux transporter [Clostridium sp.]|nr:MATE family efflux transporter [Clostridium sp.]MCM1208055.1 MATE family efflux transporter [Ruminococcus sp.]
MKELTTGKPWKVILLFAIPIICRSIFQQLYNFVDSKIVSTYISTNAFAAVGATTVVSNTIIGFLNGFTQGFAISVANSYGAKDYKKMRKYIAGSVVLAFSIAVILTAVSHFLIGDLLKLLATPEDIMEDALAYVKIILAGILFTAVYNLCANILMSVGDSKTPLYCLIAALLINTGLDILFVKVLSMGIKGAAYATIISQAIAGGLCVIYIFTRFKMIVPVKDDWRLEKKQYPELFATGLSMGLMGCIVNVGTIALQNAINKLGTAYVAAHTAARKLFDMLTILIFSMAVAMTTYVSQNMGAGKFARVRQGIRQAIYMATIATTFLIVVCYTFGEGILKWITSTNDTTIISAAVMYMKISIVFFYVLGPLLILRCSLQGMGHKIMPLFSSGMEMVIKIVSANLIVPVLAYKGVAFTEPISWVLMTIMLTVSYMIARPKGDDF